MQTIKTLEEELVELLGDWTWEAFETLPDGHLRLEGDAKIRPYCSDFYMRVGLHMERPTQAIISCGKFIRMRKEERWPGFPLVKIDPADPDTSLYDDYAVLPYQQYGQYVGYQTLNLQSIGTSLSGSRGWRPTIPAYQGVGTLGALGQNVVGAGVNNGWPNIYPQHIPTMGGWMTSTGLPVYPGATQAPGPLTPINSGNWTGLGLAHSPQLPRVK